MTPPQAAVINVDADEQAAARLESFRKRIPEAFREDGPLDDRLKEWARDLIKGSPANLILAGPTGTGKTWAAWRIAEYAVLSGYARRISFVGAAKFRELISPPADYPALSRLGTTDLLIMDDLGALRLSDWDREHLYGVIDERWSHRRPTVITTNVGDLREMLGERIASRIAPGAVPVALDGPDRRRQS
jgi:DNA replication protein DnaC